MKYMILSVLLASCMTQAPKQIPPTAVPVVHIDTVIAPLSPDVSRELDSLRRELVHQVYQLRHDMDSLATVNDTLAVRLLHARLVISNVRYYLNICLKNPKQDKFLKGWIKRALQ